MNRIGIIILSAALLLPGWGAFAAAQTTVAGHTAGGGAVISGDGVFTARGTVGQAAAGSANEVQFDARIGFWYLVAPPPLATGIEEAAETVPGVFSLEANMPNPFNPATTIPFAIPQRGRVTLRVYDVSGREVATLLDEDLDPGNHRVFFQPDRLASGIYFYRLTAGDRTDSRRMVLIK